MNQSVVVMGGSFNPPTLAHLKMLQRSMDLAEAERGFFVPVSFPYLKRKMMKAGAGHLCLPDETRLRMLKEMAASDPRIGLDTGEMGSVFADTRGTMERVQNRFPGARIFYAAGADKLGILETFEKWGFFPGYGMILVSRGGKGIRETLMDHPRLSAHVSSILFTELPGELEAVSSTRVRAHLFDPEAVADCLHPGVLALMRELKREDFPEEIPDFRGEYAFLSNDYPCAVTWDGLSFPCVTSAWIALGFEEAEARRRISVMAPGKAKQKYGNMLSGRRDEAEKAVMEDVVRRKFLQHPELVRKLRDTGNRVLMDGRMKDREWGFNTVTWTGGNRLGKVLMEIRRET